MVSIEFNGSAVWLSGGMPAQHKASSSIPSISKREKEVTLNAPSSLCLPLINSLWNGINNNLWHPQFKFTKTCHLTRWTMRFTKRSMIWGSQKDQWFENDIFLVFRATSMCGGKIGSSRLAWARMRLSKSWEQTMSEEHALLGMERTLSFNDMGQHLLVCFSLDRNELMKDAKPLETTGQAFVSGWSGCDQPSLSVRRQHFGQLNRDYGHLQGKLTKQKRIFTLSFLRFII